MGCQSQPDQFGSGGPFYGSNGDRQVRLSAGGSLKDLGARQLGAAHLAELDLASAAEPSTLRLSCLKPEHQRYDFLWRCSSSNIPNADEAAKAQARLLSVSPANVNH